MIDAHKCIIQDEYLGFLSYFNTLETIEKFAETYDLEISFEDIILHACLGENISLIKQIITKESLILPMDVLYGVVQNGHYDLLKYLIENDLIESIDSSSEFLLHLACVGYQLPKNEIRKLFHKDICEDKYLQIVQYLIEKLNFDVNKKDESNMTCSFHWACFGGHENIADYLYNHGANIRSVAKKNRNALHFACIDFTILNIDIGNYTKPFRDNSKDRLIIVKYLIEKLHFDPNSRDKFGAIPLHYACLSGFLPVVKYFIEITKCNIEDRNSEDQTPLHFAKMGKNNEVIEYLLSKGANENAQDIHGKIPKIYGEMEDSDIEFSFYMKEISRDLD